MIHCYYKEGQKLDVAGLNQITVLIDRSVTELTEVALNEWPSGLEGPPHLHAEKDQVFYITAGKGNITVGEQDYEVQPGCLIYVPAGVIHRTITTSEEPLAYILYNVFNDPEKVGHASFADHIEKVKEIRRRQAETGQYEIAGAEISEESDKQGKFFSDIKSGKVYDFGSNSTILLLDRSETNRIEFVLVQWPPGNKGAMVAHKEKEQTFFVLSGSGKVTIAEDTESLNPGDIVFVPRNTPHTTETGEEELTYLCLNSIVTATKDESFDEMYQRIAPELMEQWKSGDTSPGE
jgi:mannose-6-phosphate isomerase-like protein (cupin superfamily)